MVFDKTESAFIFDMDAQFLMVPKSWVQKLLTIKLLNLCVSLATELKQVTINNSSSTFEDELNQKIQEVSIFSRVNK